MPLQPERLNRFASTMAQTTGLAVRKCLMGVAFTFRGQNSPKTPNFGTGMPNFQPNQYTRITFERWEIDEKFQQTAYTKSGAGESNGDIIFALGRHLAAKTTSGPIFKLYKSRITCERSEIDEKCQCNTNSKPMSGYRLVTSHLLWSSPSGQNYFRFISIVKVTLLNWQRDIIGVVDRIGFW